MKDDTTTPIMSRPDAASIAAFVTPFPDFTADDDEWRVGDAVYQFNAEYLSRAITREMTADVEATADVEVTA